MFIVIEGNDGAGKSTLCKALTDKLADIYPKGNVRAYRDPGGPLGRLIRENVMATPWCRIECAKTAQAMLHMAARMQIWKTTKRRHEYGDLTLCDRWSLSTLVYQYEKENEAWLMRLVELAPKPDLQIVLDLDWQEAMRRAKPDLTRDDQYDKAFQAREERYRDPLWHTATAKQTALIDCNSKSQEQVLREAVHLVRYAMEEARA